MLQAAQHCNLYRLIIFKMFVLFTISSQNLADFSTQQYCRVEFSLKFFHKMVNKRGLSKTLLNCLSFNQSDKEDNPSLLTLFNLIALLETFLGRGK